MDTLPVAQPRCSREELAFRRLFAGALWMMEQSEGFSFPELADALGDAYEGSHQAVDRRWSRDKNALARLGIWLVLEGRDRYSVQADRHHRLVRLGLQDACILAGLVAKLPTRGLSARLDPLESALRKLLILGAPIREALLSRDSVAPGTASGAGEGPAASGTAIGLDGHARDLQVAWFVLNNLLQSPNGRMSATDATILTGAASCADLIRVVHWMERMVLPLEPPCDELPVYIHGDSVCIFQRAHRVRLLGLTPAELTALELAAASTGPDEQAWRVLDRVTTALLPANDPFDPARWRSDFRRPDRPGPAGIARMEATPGASVLDPRRAA